MTYERWKKIRDRELRSDQKTMHMLSLIHEKALKDYIDFRIPKIKESDTRGVPYRED
jgi:hypothetical protein